MQNDILTEESPGRHGVAARSVDRALAGRRAAYAEEVRRLVDASFEVIRTSGTLEPRVADILARAGLCNQAFYKHFRSKDELLLAVLDDGFEKLRGYLAHRMEKATSPIARIETWIEGVLEQAIRAESAEATRPFALSRARLAGLFPEEVAASEARLTAMLAAAIRTAADSGDLADADPEHDALTVYHLAMGWVQRKLAESAVPTRGEAQHVVAFALRGLTRSGD